MVHEPVCSLRPALVNHEVNVRGVAVAETEVNGAHFHRTIRVGVSTITEPGLSAVRTGIAPQYAQVALVSGRIRVTNRLRLECTGGPPCQISAKVWFIGAQVAVSKAPRSTRSSSPRLRWWSEWNARTYKKVLTLASPQCPGEQTRRGRSNDLQ